MKPGKFERDTQRKQLNSKDYQNKTHFKEKKAGKITRDQNMETGRHKFTESL